MHLTINPLIFLYFLILDSISIVFTTLSTLFLDEHAVETIALQEIDTIVVPFVTLVHAHIGGNHDVSFTIMHTGDVESRIPPLMRACSSGLKIGLPPLMS